MRAAFFAALLAALLAGAASAGLLYGPEHVYHLDPPDGWVIDSESGAAQGYGAVLYPKGGSWKDSPAVIYTTVQKRQGKLALAGFIAKELAPFRARGMSVTRETPILAQGGRLAELRFVSGGEYPNREAVAYFEENTVFVLIVLSAQTQAAFDDALQPFTEVVSSYRFLSGNVAPAKRESR